MVAVLLCEPVLCLTRPSTQEVSLSMTVRLVAGAALSVFLLGGSGRANDPLRSGPPVGAKNNRSGFYPQFVAGSGAGQSLCPV